MITGNGLLAKSFAHLFGQRPDVMVFAAGVSNSTQTEPEEFQRELRLLKATLAAYPAGQAFVYFGSCGAASTQSTPYMAHKRAMEELVLSHPAGLILRLPQVVGPSKNPTTLTNFLAEQILADKPIKLWRRAQRNLIDIDDIVPIASYVIDNRAEFPPCISIASARTLTMPELVREFERVLGKAASLELLDLGEPLEIDVSYSLEIAEKLGMDLGQDYPARVLNKYYGTPSHA